MLVKGSFEDFFYILVGLIWVAFSIYKGIQKKKSQQTPDQKVKKKSILETLMDEFLDQKETVQPEPIVYETPSQDIELEEEVKNEVFSYDDIYEKSNYNEVASVYSNKTDAKRKLKTNLKAASPKRKKTRFDLKKAIVYSEILNRRYF
jgi:hypothetical protein